MNIPDLEGLTEVLEGLNNVKKLTITGNSQNPKLIECINVLLVHIPGSSVDTVTNSSFRLKLSDSGSSKSIKSAWLQEQLNLEEIEISDEHFTVKGTLSGLFYSPLANAPMYLSRANNNVLLSTTEVLPASIAKHYVKDAKNMYEKHLKDYMPAVRLLEVSRVKNIRASQEARGFTRIPEIGDEVVIMGYAEMCNMYGEDTQTASIAFAKTQSSTYGVPFIKPLEHLAGIPAIIADINNSTGIVRLKNKETGEFITDINNITIDGVERRMSPPPKFHEQSLRKI